MLRAELVFPFLAMSAIELRDSRLRGNDGFFMHPGY
jgi:hypothetical protein